MKYAKDEKIAGFNSIGYIFTDSGETERTVLREFLKASFNLAPPGRGLSRLSYNQSHMLTDSEADNLIIHPPRFYDDCVAEIRFQEGRECRTTVRRCGDGFLAVDLDVFERFRQDFGAVMQATALSCGSKDNVLTIQQKKFIWEAKQLRLSYALEKTGLYGLSYDEANGHVNICFNPQKFDVPGSLITKLYWLTKPLSLHLVPEVCLAPAVSKTA